MKREFAAQKTELSDKRSRSGDFNPTVHNEHFQRRRQDLQLNLLFQGLILAIPGANSFQSFPVYQPQQQQSFGAFPNILKDVQSSYEIPFVLISHSMNFRNNKSPELNAHFVSVEISRLMN